MNLGELRKLTEHLSDDVEIVRKSDNYELHGNIVKARGIRLINVKKEKRNFRDDFDGTNYSSEVFVLDKDGEEMLYI